MSICPTCNSQARYIQEYGQYYCDKCQAYVPVQQQQHQPAHQPQHQQQPTHQPEPQPVHQPQQEPEPQPEVELQYQQQPESQPEPQPEPQPAYQPQPQASEGGSYKIVGEISPVLEYQIKPGVRLFGQPGLMVSRDPTVSMEGMTKGGLGKALGRKLLTGETMTQMEYTGQGTLRLSAGYTGKIMDIKLTGVPLRSKSGAYIAADGGIDVGTTTEKIGTAIVGGTGFFQLLFTGQGTVFLQSVGDIIEGELSPGQELVIDENHFLACDDTVQRARERVKGFRNIMTGGEGLYTLKLIGPGRYWIETGNLWTATSGATRT